MPVNYPPDMSKQLTVLFQRDKLQGTNRDLGQSSMSPGDGLLEIRDGGGRVAAGLGDLPDNTVGLGIFRNGTFKNVNAWFYDRGQVDTSFAERDRRLDQKDANDTSHQQQLDAHTGRLNQKDANDASHQSQLNTLRGDITRLDGVDASIGQQLGDRPTYAVYNAGISGLSGRVTTAQNTANGAQGAADSAATAARNAQNDASGALQAAVANATTIVALTARVNSLQDQIDKMKANGGG